MLFEINRTSNWDSKPCNEAKVIYKENGVKLYCVEINTLEDLLKFVDTYGDIVISNALNASETGAPKHIEIYDNLRE